MAGLATLALVVLATGAMSTPATNGRAAAIHAAAGDATVIDDFENGLPRGTDSYGNAIGFFTFRDAASSVGISTTDTPPAPVPDAATPNNVLRLDTNVSGNFGYAGIVHAFENEFVDRWAPQDWSSFTGLRFWLYGNDTGSILFLDILDNRAPGSTRDTAERYSIDIVDDFSGWRLIEIPFTSLHRKEIGNGAPNDGLTLTEVHGWAFGVFDSGWSFTNFLDDLSLYGQTQALMPVVSFAANAYDLDEGSTGQIGVKLNRPLGDDDPDSVSVDYSIEASIAEAGKDFVPLAPGTLTFEKGGASELFLTLETLDDSKHEGTERLILRLSNPVDLTPGFLMRTRVSIRDDDAYDALLLDDFEDGLFLWSSTASVVLANPDIAADAPDALPGQGSFEGVLDVGLPPPEHVEIHGKLCNRGNGVVPVKLRSTEQFDATAVDHRTVLLGDAGEAHVDWKTGEPKRHEDGDDLVFHFRFNETGLPCNPSAVPFSGLTFDGQPIAGQLWRDFPLGQDWSSYEGLRFWYHGSGTGAEIAVTLKDNRADDPGPDGWELVWADEFDAPAGTPPDPAMWRHEIGDGTLNGALGWGNNELQYYTDSTENAATDGLGHLVITAREADGSLGCYYGPCRYTSARLITARRAEFAYGRIESRFRVPDGEAGLWPAFWMLGTNIGQVGWPRSGEIDILEYVSRLPHLVFGTVHGPGYSGGSAFGNFYYGGGMVADDFHTFAIEWQPNRIDWYVDGVRYHTASPADVSPYKWVFNDPFFVIVNLAIGGNFGGALSPLLTFPQALTIDYVRVYQGPDTAERWQASFVDEIPGWREVEIPFHAFSRSALQPTGAPDDGLGLDEIWGYGFGLDDVTGTATFKVDQVRLVAPSGKATPRSLQAPRRGF